MRILHLSDTHGKHNLLKKLPKAELIIHSGDISWKGEIENVTDFIVWFGNLGYKYKIFIAGNHDDCLYNATIDGMPENCFYLCNSGIEIDGIKFWGVPHFVQDDIEGKVPHIMVQIPVDTDVLITHNPPYGILDTTDNMYGCPDLLQAVLKIKPKYHLFGHIHGAYGIEKSNSTTFINASIIDHNYTIVNEPVLFEI